MKIGYARVSTKDQNLDLQLDALMAAGCEKINTDKISSVKDRPELNKALSYLRKGDTFVIWRLDRLGRSLKDLVNIVDDMQSKGIDFISLNDSIDSTTSSGRLIFGIFASLAAFERELIIERTKAGLEAARIRGRIGGRPQGLSNEAKLTALKAKKLYIDSGFSVDDICSMLSIGKSTLYRYLKYMNVKLDRR